MDIEELYTIRCETPHNIDRHLPLLRYLAGRVNIVTEFGTDAGWSTTAFLAARPYELHSYDLNFDNPCLQEVIDAKPAGVVWKRIQANTLNVEIEETGLLFIDTGLPDTGHTYDQLLGELSLHGDKVKHFIAIHDIASFPRIAPAIREWLHLHPEWIVREWSLIQSGMAVLERRSVVEPAAVYAGTEP